MKIGKKNIYALPPNDVRLLHMYAQQLQENGTARQWNRSGITNLLIGEPDFPTPEHIREAAIEAIKHNAIGYGPPAGWPWLRSLLAEKIKRVNDYAVNSEQVAVTMGGTGAVQATLMAVIGRGDEILVPDPGWPQYQLQIACCGARAIRYELSPSSGWLPDPAQLEKLISRRSRMLIINTPANPSGAVFSRQLVANLLSFAQRHDLYLLSDECYDEILFEGEHVSPASLLSNREFESGRVICIYTFSKTYAMTGWRIGYLAAGKELIKTIIHVLDSTYTNICTFVQAAAAAALTGPQTCVQEMLQAYQKRRDCALASLSTQGRYFYTPQGTFYLLIDISNSYAPELQGNAFARLLLRKRAIAVAPGSSFGQVAPYFVRVSLVAPEQDIVHGIDEICTLANSDLTVVDEPF
ncbi:MAG: pyridoxal phosphate-dependent aminotransferase [Ktedonobacteraceae bacterium]|nr:pyridoxal phosphate-dependent aminotransferase [Ktedonobacteraceae bacterium]